MAHSVKDKLQTLGRRRDYLEKRVAEAEAQGRGSSFDKAEASALRWAMEVIERVQDQLEQEATVAADDPAGDA
jgi:hypothetical protein